VGALVHATHTREIHIDSYDSYTSNAQAGATVGLVLLAFVAFVVAVVVVNYLLTAVPLAGLFRKTGVEPWKAWVPVLNTYTWLRLGGQNGNWAWASLVPYGSVVTSVFLYVGMHRTGRAFGKGTGFLVLGIFLPWVWLLILGFGRAEYRPHTLAVEGYGPPLVGDGAPPPALPGVAGPDGVLPGTPPEYTATAYLPPRAP
jgi:hypothetical protein